MNVCTGPQELYNYNIHGHEPYKEGLYHITIVTVCVARLAARLA